MYALIHENAIQVGPRNWNHSFFIEYLNDNDLDSSELPFNDPNESIITNEWKILKVSITEPTYDRLFEQLAGPYYTINETDITGYYNVLNADIPLIKGHMKSIVAANRYNVEVGGINFTFSDNQIVELYTTREDRNIYLDALLVIGENDTIDFKFKNSIFKTVTKLELQAIVTAGSQHIRDVFSWESAKVMEIDNATTIEALKLIELRHPNQIGTS